MEKKRNAKLGALCWECDGCIISVPDLRTISAKSAAYEPNSQC